MTSKTDGPYHFEDDALTASLQSLARTIKRSTMIDLHCGMPAKVLKFIDAAGGRPCMVQAQLGLKFAKIDDKGNETLHEYPPVTAIVEYYGAGGFGVSARLEKGETGWLKFSDRSLELWIKNGGPADPVFSRAHSLTDAVFEPGAKHGKNAFAAPPSGVLRVGSDDGAHVLEINRLTGVITVKTTAKVTLDAAAVELTAGATEGLVKGTSFLALFNAHTHTTGVGPSGPPTPPMTSPAHVSTKVKTG